MRLRILLYGYALLCSSSIAVAQSTGRVSGWVLDQTGAALPGVVIDLLVEATELSTTTDEQGRYVFDAVPAGQAELTYRMLNFSVAMQAVALASGEFATADVTMALALDADVIVMGAATFRNVAEI